MEKWTLEDRVGRFIGWLLWEHGLKVSLIAFLVVISLLAWREQTRPATPEQVQAEALQSIARDMSDIRREMVELRRCQCKR